MLRVKSANLAVKFLLEIWAVAGFALWGTTVASGAAAVVFAMAAVALLAAGSTAVAIVFGALAAINAVLLTVFGQWEQ